MAHIKAYPLVWKLHFIVKPTSKSTIGTSTNTKTVASMREGKPVFANIEVEEYDKFILVSADDSQIT